MKKEHGFTLLELLVSIAIVGVVGTAATTVTFQSIKETQTSNDRMMVVQQDEDVSYSLSHDAEMAESIAVLSYPNLVEFTWTQWNLTNGSSVYYTVTYAFVNLTNGVGQLQRTYQSSAGADTQTTVCRYIYYNANDPNNTTSAMWQDPLLTVQMTSKVNSTQETRVFQIVRRVNI